LRSKSVLTLFLFFMVTVLGEGEKVTLDEIFLPQTYKNYLKANYPEQLRIIRTAIQSVSTRLKIQISRGEQKEFIRSLAEIKTLSDEAFAKSEEVTSEKMLRHKEVKRMEIFLRKEIDLLEELKLEVPYEIRENFYQPKDSLDKLRNKLFIQLFESARSFQTELGSGGFSFTGDNPNAAKAVRSAPTQGLHTIDRFTEEEFRKIQIARTLKYRLKAIREIAKSRIDEIDRRRKGEEWNEKDPNPLEFYTYEDLLHAFSRALEASMHSIDEHVERVLSPMDEIEDALEDLNEDCKEYQPRLNDLEPLIREIGSLDLAMKLSKALEFNSTALKGTESGLESLKRE
jgi:hypothetical protein